MAKKQVKPMSVVRAAPVGWEFQYAATAMIGLELLERHGSTLFIEPAGGEDAELTLEIKCGKLVVEIQAKSSQTDIDSSVLAAYLANFPNRRATDNLLARLAQSENRVALFVVGARCNDATRGFLTQAGRVQSHSKSIVTRSHLNDLIAKFAIAHHSKAPSKLESARHAFCQSLAAKLSADHSSATSVAQRIVIWEQLQKHDLEKEIELRVSQEFFVPKTRSRIARLALVEAVRLARDEQVDLIPKLKAVVAEFAGMRILNGSYSHRGQEAQLFDELKQQRVLFLTGQSMCGKSQTARYLAEEFRKGGVTCEIGNYVPEAVRYLNAVGQDDRLFLLDDPFGHLTLNANTAEDLSRLRNLITTVPPHRFLIVTSRNDIIAVAGANPPSPEFIWHDLTVQSPEFLVHFWKTECAGKGLSIGAFNTVLQNLPKMKPSELLQPGQLRHLAHIRDSVPESNFLALCGLARRNSADLANSFKLREGAIQELHAALALGATSIDPLPVHDLNYLLSANELQPGIHLKDEIETVRLGYNEPPPPFPADPNVAPISAIQSDELSLLEQRGFIRVCQNQITFAHPDYFEASTLVLLGSPTTRFKKILEIATLAVTGLDPAVAKRALRQLPRMYDSYALPEQRSDFIKLAFLALNSIFPSVRDLALTTLVSWIDTLKKDDQDRVLNFVARSDLRFDDILWHNGVPWLNPKPRTNVNRLFGIGRVSIEQAKEAQLVARLLDPLQSSISVNEAWELVTAFKSKPKDEISFPALKALMRYEEGFIRAEAAFLLEPVLNFYRREWRA